MDFGWNVSKIADYEAVCFDIAEESFPLLGVVKGNRAPKPITHAMAAAAIYVGMSEITTENHREFFGRLRFRESTAGPLMTEAGEPRFIRFDEVTAFIGLTTNAKDLALVQWLMLWAPGTVRDIASGADGLIREGPEQVEF